MTEPQVDRSPTDPTTSEPSLAAPVLEPAPVLVPRRSLIRVVRDQRKTVLVAIVLVVACFWVMGPMGEWLTATLTGVGILLALGNHIAGEYWLAKLISSGDEPTRGSIASSAFTRLLVLSVVAVGIAALFWPNGVGLLLGLAIFRLIALVMTGIPLLKELKKP